MRFGHPGTPLDKRRQSLDNRRATAFALLSLINIVPVTLRHSSNFILIFHRFPRARCSCIPILGKLTITNYRFDTSTWYF